MHMTDRPIGEMTDDIDTADRHHRALKALVRAAWLTPCVGKMSTARVATNADEWVVRCDCVGFRLTPVRVLREGIERAHETGRKISGASSEALN
jgi:hypothetical protein